MSRTLTSRLIQEVQHALTAYSPAHENTDREQLAALARSVLGSVDIRDLRGVQADRLVAQLEHLLHTIAVRRRSDVLVALHYEEQGGVLVVETCIDDQPFLVSTLRAAMAAEHFEVRRFMNAIVQVRRDPAGRLVSIGTGASESVMRIEVATLAGSAARDGGGVPHGVAERIEQRLRLAQSMVRDFEAMKARIGNAADAFFAAAHDLHGEAAVATREAESFLRWMCDENFVLLAVEEYDLHGEPTNVLGTSRVERPHRDLGIVTAAARATPAAAGGPTAISGNGQGRLVRYQRTTEESPVHRAGKPGEFVVTRLGDDGSPSGAVLVRGLFTYKALHTPPEEIPVVRVVLRDLLLDRHVSEDSDRGKNLTNAFNSLPLEYLLTEDRDSIWELTDRILRAEAEHGSDVHIRIGEASRFAFVFVALPRAQYSEELRQHVQDLLLEALCGSYADYGVYIDRYENAVLHFYITGVGPLKTVDTEELRTKILAHARSWSDRLREALGELVQGPRLDELFDVYEDAFTEEHKRRCSVERIKRDIQCLESLRGGADIDCDLYVSMFGDNPGSLNLRMFSRQPLNLSRELPVLSHFGFEVIDEYSRDVRVAHLGTIDMDNFRFELRTERIGQVMGRRRNIIQALREVFAGRVGDDDLNRLVVVSDLTVRDVEILRAYVALLHQLVAPFSSDLIRQTLVANPTVAEALMAWLSARFDPKIASPELERSSEELLDTELREITDYTADRVCQAVAEVVRATRRTNAYVADREAGQAFAFKIASSELSFGPEPRPMREIWVYHPEFEGVHLRGGRVARGGLRFSDRPEDFRTEIHGLMATQMVKNVVIVPVGAKGGFVLRNPPSERDALRAAGDHYYERFVRSLLALTDNVVDGSPRTPEGILPYKEGPDPYLVVAADKGTAHMSDTANRVSAENQFWLDDAFASGGSAGYDHKATGITARGAWEVTKRSFREMGIDPEVDVITAMGVGDMSGDVFGNGLLRSKTIKLRAAFNHAHIFVDPDPDPARSFVERQRLFDKPRSQWSDYDAAVLSEGGGVYPRKAKEVPLSPQARAMLGLPAERRVSGEEVVRAILRMDVDLCWMGGIGTYVKSKDESNVEVGDKTNDGARVDAAEMRCKVLAEGANLAITDRGRVELARGGAHNYNAFLDNSGGVDTSDHEVNIKILFAPLLRSGKITRERRNEAMRACENEVVEMVLDNNRSQSRLVSYDVRRAKGDPYRYSRTLAFLAGAIPFDPGAFALPGEEELANRGRKGLGLFKCEAAVLGAHAKMLAYRALLEEEPLPDPMVDAAVREYFPRAIVDVAGAQAAGSHLLRREIATTMIVNRIIDQFGASFLAEVGQGTGKSTRDIVVATMHAADACGLWGLMDEVFALEDKKRQDVVYAAMQMAGGALEDATFYLLDQMPLPALDPTMCAQSRELLANVDKSLPTGSKNRTAARMARLEEQGMPRAIAERVVKLRYLTPVIDAVRMAQSMRHTPAELLHLRLQVTDAVNFLNLNQAIDRMAYTTQWDGPAVNALRRQLYFHLHKLVRLVEGMDVEGMIERYKLRSLAKLVAAQAEGPTISGLVMLDDWLRRMLPPLSALRE